jgi:pilus assembly protein CpaC
VGPAFSAKSHNEIEEELLVLVTPHLIDPMDCSQVPKYLPGQETRTPDDFELFLEGILEAPRGARQVFEENANGREIHYRAAYKNDPTARVYPCVDRPRGGLGGLGCANGCNGTPGSLTPGVTGTAQEINVPGTPQVNDGNPAQLGPVTTEAAAPPAVAPAGDNQAAPLPPALPGSPGNDGQR